jgi:hypothetical protein
MRCCLVLIREGRLAMVMLQPAGGLCCTVQCSHDRYHMVAMCASQLHITGADAGGGDGAEWLSRYHAIAFLTPHTPTRDVGRALRQGTKAEYTQQTPAPRALGTWTAGMEARSLVKAPYPCLAAYYAVVLGIAQVAGCVAPSDLRGVTKQAPHRNDQVLHLCCARLPMVCCCEVWDVICP